MKTIDPTILAGYNAGIERDRLRTGIGLLEFERTKKILLEKLPRPRLSVMLVPSPERIEARMLSC